MQWIDAGPSRDGDLELVLVEKFPGDPTREFVPTYRFQMLKLPAREPAGDIELRVGDTDHLRLYAGHLGFNVTPEHRGNRLALRAARLILPIACEHEMTELWITCNPDNAASRRTCELLGATLIEIVDLPADTDMFRDGDRKKRRYRLRLD